MNSEKILQADMLDLLFENRNKKYGAYTLRKEYNGRMYKALGLICLLVLTLTLLSFVRKDNDKDKTVLITREGPELAPPPKDKPVPPKPPTPRNCRLHSSPLLLHRRHRLHHRYLIHRSSLQMLATKFIISTAVPSPT